MLERIAVLGLDALTWEYVNKIIEKCAASNLKFLIRRAHNSILEAEFPPMTPPSWTSILTGVNPGKHGIFSFDYVDRITYKQRLYNASNLMHPRIHEMLSFNGLKSIMINPIPSHPIIPVRYAKIISHLFFVERPEVFPKSLSKYIRGLPKSPVPRRDVKFFIDYIRILDSYVQLVENLVYIDDWSLFWLNINFPDNVLHLFPEILDTDKWIEYERLIVKRIEKIIAILLANSDAFILVSDHGFRMYRWALSINDLLVRIGCAKVSYKTTMRDFHELLVKHEDMTKESILLKRTVFPLLGLIYSNLFHPIRANILKPIFLKLPSKIKDKIFPSIYVDPRESDAFMSSASSFGVYIKNEKKRNLIIRSLSKLKGIKWVKEKEKIYNGPHVKRAPDILICPDFENEYFLLGSKIYRKIILRKKAGNHHPHGVFSIYTKDGYIKSIPGGIISAKNVTPIIMILLGQPLSKATDDLEKVASILDVKEKLNLTSKYIFKWRIIRAHLFGKQHIK